MSLITFVVAGMAALVTALLTFLAVRQKAQRIQVQLETRLDQSLREHGALRQQHDTLNAQCNRLQLANRELETRLETSSARLTEEQQRREQLEQKIAGYEQAVQQARQLEGQAQEQAVQLERLRKEQQQLVQTLDSARMARSEAEKQTRELETRLQEQQAHNRQAIEQLNDSKVLLRQEFNNLANEIFEQKNRVFSEQHRERLETMLNPFREQISEFQRRIEESHKEGHAGRAALRQQLEMLHQLNQKMTDEASNLARALKGDKKLQGNWGELQVEKILESSGLIKGQEYEREASFKNDEGQNRRPDFIVHLPEGKHLVIDSKVSLVDYMAYVNAEDEGERAQAMTRHIQCVRNHIKRLSEKGYTRLQGIEAPDLVFMFMPIEPAFMAAFQHDQKLFNDAFEQRIVVVTPTTLLATLRTVANLWTIERQNTNARKLADRAGLLYDKLRVFIEKMEKLDSQLGTARCTYDEAMNTLKQGRGNLVAQVNEFVSLGVRVKKEISRKTLDSADLSVEQQPQGARIEAEAGIKAE